MKSLQDIINECTEKTAAIKKEHPEISEIRYRFENIPVKEMVIYQREMNRDFISLGGTVGLVFSASDLITTLIFISVPVKHRPPDIIEA